MYMRYNNILRKKRTRTGERTIQTNHAEEQNQTIEKHMRDMKVNISFAWSGSSKKILYRRLLLWRYAFYYRAISENIE